MMLGKNKRYFVNVDVLMTDEIFRLLGINNKKRQSLSCGFVIHYKNNNTNNSPNNCQKLD